MKTKITTATNIAMPGQSLLNICSLF